MDKFVKVTKKRKPEEEEEEEDSNKKLKADPSSPAKVKTYE